MSDALHVKYRPATLDEVVGQDAVVDSLAKVLERKNAQTFLFAGPAGTGKTTLARIAARESGCASKDIMEIDAATHTGIDSMRSIQDVLRYKPFGKGERRAVVIDEAHGLSKQSWDALLKVTEEPPKHIMWFFCTTNPSKVPATIKSRAIAYTLKPVDIRALAVLLNRVCKAEKIKLDEGVRDLIQSECQGSPRQLLVNLEICRDARDKKAAADLLRSAQASDGIIEYCRFIIKGSGSWAAAMAVIKKLENENPESVRIVTCNYLGSALKNAKSDKEAMRLLMILDAFSEPYVSSENLAPLLLSTGRVLFQS